MNTFTSRLARWGTRPAADIVDAGERLITEARAASTLRGYQSDPDVAALTIERTRERVERVLLIAMTCGLLYTTVNVQSFIAGTAEKFGLAWWAAWLVEPFVTTGVLALLRIEQVARRNRVIPGPWVRWTRWTAFAVTYVFNTWEAWTGGDPQEIVKHSAIPLLVFFFAEALTDGRDALTEAATLVTGARMPERSDAESVTEPLPLSQPVVLAAPEPSVTTGLPPAPDAPPGPVQGAKLPKGYLKTVAIPAAYRELALEALGAGRSLDTVSLADVDRRAGTSKYATGAMIAPLREQIEKEEVHGARV